MHASVGGGEPASHRVKVRHKRCGSHWSPHPTSHPHSQYFEESCGEVVRIIGSQAPERAYGTSDA